MTVLTIITIQIPQKNEKLQNKNIIFYFKILLKFIFILKALKFFIFVFKLLSFFRKKPLSIQNN